MRWCEENDIPTNPKWHKYRPKFKLVEQEIIYLTENELQRLFALKIPPTKKYLQNVRDVFLFCCFSGLRYSDVAKLRPCDIYENAMHLQTRKTNDILTIELNDITQKIVAKHASGHPETDELFAVCSNQNYNIYIKELCQLAKIDTPITRRHFVGAECVETTVPKWQLITSHCARRTFVVLALTLSVPLEVIMKWTGHNDTKAIKPYVAIVEELKKKEMEKLNVFAHNLPT